MGTRDLRGTAQTEAVSGPAKTWLSDTLGEYRVALMAVFVHAFVRGYRPIPLRYVIIRAYFDGVGGVGVDDTVGAAGGGVVVVGGR